MKLTDIQGIQVNHVLQTFFQMNSIKTCSFSSFRFS